jgi:quinol monooxygenase YgiN
MNWLRGRVRAWLGIETVDTGLALLSHTIDDGFEIQQDQRAALEDLVKKNVESTRGLAQALQAAVAQLNRNTVMMDRWVRSSATLGDIERRHARQEQKAEAVVANGHSRIITPEGL